MNFPSDWDCLPVDDCMERIIDYRGKTPSKSDSGIPLITAKIIKGGRIETPNEFIAESDYLSWMRRGMPRIGDVLITTEAPMGEVAQLCDDRVALAQRVILLRGKKEILDNTYLKYCLMGDFLQNQLQSRMTGTTVPGIKQRELRKVMIPLPSVAEQRAIGEVLSRLDQKIESNRRNNQTLNIIIQATFRAWFVDFEPVKAKAAGLHPVGMDTDTADLFNSAFVESEQGPIPAGWRWGTIGDLAINHRENIDPTTLVPNIPYIGLEHMPQKSIALDSWGYSSDVDSTKARFQRMDILFGKLRPYFHKVGVAPLNGICSTDILVIRPKRDEYLGLLLAALSSDDLIAYASRYADGAKMPRVNWKDLAAYPIALPPDQLQGVFSELVQGIIAKIHNNIHQSRTLAQMRDTLLPRLISGQLRVPVEEPYRIEPELLIEA